MWFPTSAKPRGPPAKNPGPPPQPGRARAWAIPATHAAASTRPAQARHARHGAPAPRAAHGLCPWVHFLAVAIGSFCCSVAGLLRGTDGNSMSGGEVSLCLMLVMSQPGRWLGDGRLCYPFLLFRKYWRAVAQCSLTGTSQRGVSHNGFEPGSICLPAAHANEMAMAVATCTARFCCRPSECLLVPGRDGNRGMGRVI